MENRCVCCGEIIPEGRMVCPLCQEKPNERLKVGDTIKCSTSKEMVDLMMLLHGDNFRNHTSQINKTKEDSGKER